MDENAIEKIHKISSEFFDLENDSEQIPANMEYFHLAQGLHSDSLIYKLHNSEPIAWVFSFPTSQDLAAQFLEKKINERELFDRTLKDKNRKALYLCAVFVVPAHRRKYLALELLKESINSIDKESNMELFAWPVSKEGNKLCHKLESVTGRKIRLRG